MSTPYIALYATDFLAGVGHLGNTELGIYWRLLLIYYRDARPLPFDSDRLRRLAMTFSPEEFRSLDAVISEFFVLSTEPDGTRVWRHKRADKELASAADKHDSASKKALAAANARWARGKPGDASSMLQASRDAPSIAQALPEAMLEQCQPEPEPEPEQQQTKSKTKTARQRAAPAVLVSVAEMVAEGVDKQSATDWLVARKTKSLPLTPTAWAETKAEAVKANMTVSEAVRIAAGNGWAGFKAKWLIDAKTSVETKTSFTRDREAAAARWIGSAKLSGSRGSFIDMESADGPAHAIR